MILDSSMCVSGIESDGHNSGGVHVPEGVNGLLRCPGALRVLALHSYGYLSC